MKISYKNYLAPILLAALGASTACPGCKAKTKNIGQRGDGGEVICQPGEVRCLGSEEQRCNSTGTDWETTLCEHGCVEGRGCVACIDGRTYCDPDANRVLLCQNEQLVPDHDCAPEEGCVLGQCVSLCDPSLLQRSNEGCEFWAVDLDNWYGTDIMNPDASGEQFSVVVTNLNDFQVTVTTEINEAAPGEPLNLSTVDQRTIGPLELVQIDLPQREVDGSVLNQNDGTGTALTSRAFRLTSTGPIIAYQFNPVYQMHTNDASILIPRRALDTRYWVMGYAGIGIAANPINPESTNFSFMTVVGTEPNTSVTVTLSADIAAGGPISDWTPAGSTIQVNLGPFDVLNLEAHCPAGMDMMTCMEQGVTDFTGSLVQATAPVAVFGGVECINISDGSGSGCCCDHLEEQIFPAVSLGSNFVAPHSPYRGGSEPDLWRVLADYDGTIVTTNLPSPNDSFTLDSGEWAEFYATADFIITATHPLLVGQYLVSQDHTQQVTGDPALTTFPPVEQYRDRYIFLVPATFDYDYAVVIQPQGATVTLDGLSLPGEFSSCTTSTAGTIDNTTWDVIRCPLEDGVHTLTADQPVGLAVYGYGPAGSYAYPGGADVREINVPR